jgi:hypothetical protein
MANKPPPKTKDKATCIACGGTYPADAPTCWSCKWRQDETPNDNDRVIAILLRMARQIDSMRFYMWQDREGDNR